MAQTQRNRGIATIDKGWRLPVQNRYCPPHGRVPVVSSWRSDDHVLQRHKITKRTMITKRLMIHLIEFLETVSAVVFAGRRFVCRKFYLRRFEAI